MTGPEADEFVSRLVGRRVVGVGTDLVDVDDIRGALARQPRFAERAFTAAECAYCRLATDPAERFAARWAAKEAVLKALAVGFESAALTDIEVVREAGGGPGLALAGRAARLAEAAGVGSWLVTMSHSRHLAHAVVAAIGHDVRVLGRDLDTQPDGRYGESGTEGRP